jgi:hypothetical protein
MVSWETMDFSRMFLLTTVLPAIHSLEILPQVIKIKLRYVNSKKFEKTSEMNRFLGKEQNT